MHCCSASVERRSSNKARSHLKHHFQQRHTCLEKVRRLSKVQRIASLLMGGLAVEAPRCHLKASPSGWRIYWGPDGGVYLQGTKGHFVVRIRPLNSGTKQVDQGRGKAVVQPVRHITVTRTQLVGGVDTCEGACYPNLEEVPRTHTYTQTHTILLSNDVARDFCSYML